MSPQTVLQALAVNMIRCKHRWQHDDNGIKYCNHCASVVLWSAK